MLFRKHLACFVGFHHDYLQTNHKQEALALRMFQTAHSTKVLRNCEQKRCSSKNNKIKITNVNFSI